MGPAQERDPVVVRVDPDRVGGAGTVGGSAHRRRTVRGPGLRRRAATLTGLVALSIAVGAGAAGRGAPVGPAPGADRQDGGTAGPTITATGPDAGGTSAASEDGEDAVLAPPTLLAVADGVLVLALPAREAVLVGFHQASGPESLPLEPVGRVLIDRLRDVPRPPDDERGGPYLVLASRGRGLASTSSVDVVVTDDTPILSPVTGTVVDVRPTSLYGTHPDLRIEIVPDDAPHLRVVLIHVRGVRVAVDDRVVAGRTVIAAGARRFPFRSQIDDDVRPEPLPHVHLEVQPVDAPRTFAGGS